MAWINYDHVAEQMRSAGLVFDSLDVGTAKIVRCAADGLKGKPGWYRLYAFSVDSGGEVICGTFGVFSGPDTEVFKVALDKDSLPRLSAEQIAAEKARRLADKREADARLKLQHEKAAAKASGWWRKCAAIGDSAYLVRKGLPAGRLYGARLSPDGNLVVPVQDASGKTWGLQVIYHDPETKKRKGRDKDFAPAGLCKKGHFFIIGSVAPGGVALLCEGFATGATLYEATGLPVVVAFDANNLAPVALAVTKHYRGLRLLIAADDDYLQTCSACKAWTPVLEPECATCGELHRKKNAGIDAARTAALPTNAAIIWPLFPGDRPTTHKGATDFNDLHVHPDGGLAMVARQVEASLSALNWRAAKPATIRAAAEAGGGGNSERDVLQSIYTLDEAVERWTLLYGGDGAYFDGVDRCIVKKADVLSLIHDHAAREWKLRPDRKVARFSGVGFDPTEKDANVTCNLWGGWPTTAKAGDCEVLLDLLRYMCKLEPNADEVYRWALRWLAYPIQHPGAKLKTTMVFHGLQGAGKNAFFEAYADIYGQYSAIVDQRAIESQFNDWASKKLFIVFDEVIARNEVYGLKNLIKSLITGRSIRINPKNMSAWDETNHANGVWLSNEQHPAAVELSDRRYFVIYTPPALSESYYHDVKACLDNGGREALHHHLLNLDLGDFHEHSKPPMTKAKAELQQLSAGSVERFVIEWLAGETRWPFCPCASSQIYRAYSKWCTAQGEKPRIQNALSGYLGKQPGWSIDRKDVFSTAHYAGSPARTRMVLPPDGLLPKGFRKTPDKTESQWATDCYFAFDHALGGVNDD